MKDQLRRGRTHYSFLFGCLIPLTFTLSASAQESIRPSLTGAIASEARHPVADRTNYNLKAGPVTFDLRGELSLEYNDNINIADRNKESDLILRPLLGLNAFWQVTQLNALSLDLTFGYAKYFDHSDFDTKSVLIAPNSQIAFDIFVGDFRINLHDRFSISEDPIEEGALSNVSSNFARFENTAGFSVLWDLNDVKLVFGYDFYSFKAITGDFKILDRVEHQVTFSADLRLADNLEAGFDAGFGATDYEENFNNDALSAHGGPFLEWQISNYLRLRATAGYQAISFDSGGGNTDKQDASAPFAVLTLANRLNSAITQDLSAGYETRLGITTNFIKTTFVRYQANWKVNRIINLHFDAFFEDLNESSGLQAEKSQRVGTGVGIDFQLTKKASVGLRYEFVNKDSDLQDRDYTQNRAIIRVGYDF